MIPLKVIINDVEFEQIPNPVFVVYGEKDKFPFLDSVLQDTGFKIRKYHSIIIDGKFFAPKIY